MSWNGKKVLVTGAGGFIGSHLVDRLIALGAQVTAFVRYTSRNHSGFLPPSTDPASLRIVYGDATDLEAVRSVVGGSEVVFHLAALVGIPYSYVHTSEVFAVNTIGTLNVLTAAKGGNISKVVVTSTSEVYGTAVSVPINETHPKQPQSPYSASKIAADAIALSFHHAFDVPVAIVRPFNTYGPRQSDRAIIPTIISQALTRDEITIGNTNPTRDFTFVADTVDGFIKAGESDKSVGQEINLGSAKEISIMDLARKIACLVGRTVEIKQAGQRMRPMKSEVERLLSDNSKSRQLLDWQPRVGLDEGLDSTIRWVRDNLEMYNPNLYRI